MILDYAFHGKITCFIHIKGYDWVSKQSFDGIIRMVDGIPYGDLINEGRSILSSECIEFIRQNVHKKAKEGYFK